MALLDDEIKKFVGEQAELGCWNQDFEYRLRRALIRYHTIKSKELRERVKELEAKQSALTSAMHDALSELVQCNYVKANTLLDNALETTDEL